MKFSLLFGLALAVQITAAHAQAVVQAPIDLKTDQVVSFKNGRMHIIDFYAIRKIGNPGQQLHIKIIQTKTADSNQSCGTLNTKFIRFEGDGGQIDIPMASFLEFVGAANYYTKFRDRWESMTQGKTKRLEYQFSDDEIFSIVGNKDDLSMTLRKKDGMIFSTKDLRVMSSFTDGINETRKFAETHAFDECL